MRAWTGKQPIGVVTACLREDGIADFAFTEIEVTQEEYRNGVHCDLVENRLIDAGYGEPFDPFDSPSFLLPAVREYLAGGRADPAIHIQQEEA